MGSTPIIPPIIPKAIAADVARRLRPIVEQEQLGFSPVAFASCLMGRRPWLSALQRLRAFAAVQDCDRFRPIAVFDGDAPTLQSGRFLPNRAVRLNSSTGPAWVRS